MTLRRREDDITCCKARELTKKNSHPPQLCQKIYSTYIFYDFFFSNFILVFTFLVAVEFWANVVSKFIVQVGLHLGKRAASARFGTGTASPRQGSLTEPNLMVSDVTQKKRISTWRICRIHVHVESPSFQTLCSTT